MDCHCRLIGMIFPVDGLLRWQERTWQHAFCSHQQQGVYSCTVVYSLLAGMGGPVQRDDHRLWLQVFCEGLLLQILWQHMQKAGL